MTDYYFELKETRVGYAVVSADSIEEAEELLKDEGFLTSEIEESEFNFKVEIISRGEIVD